MVEVHSGVSDLQEGNWKVYGFVYTKESVWVQCNERYWLQILSKASFLARGERCFFSNGVSEFVTDASVYEE